MTAHNHGSARDEPAAQAVAPGWWGDDGREDYAIADMIKLWVEAREERLRAELLDTQREVAHLRGGWREMKAQRDAALAKYDRLVEQVRRQIRGTSSAATVRDGLRAAVVDSLTSDERGVFQPGDRVVYRPRSGGPARDGEVVRVDDCFVYVLFDGYTPRAKAVASWVLEHVRGGESDG